MASGNMALKGTERKGESLSLTLLTHSMISSLKVELLLNKNKIPLLFIANKLSTQYGV
jgi:hypothetical protein